MYLQPRLRVHFGDRGGKSQQQQGVALAGVDFGLVVLVLSGMNGTRDDSRQNAATLLVLHDRWQRHERCSRDISHDTPGSFFSTFYPHHTAICFGARFSRTERELRDGRSAC